MITILTMTMNGGKGIPGSTLRWALRHNFSQFEKVVVVDGDLTEEAKEFYAQFKNVQVIDSPWKDSYVTQYQKAADTLKDGEYGLWLDDDEILQDPKFFLNWQGTADIVKIPCVLHLTDDGNSYFAAEKQPPKEFKNGMWTKNILFKKNDGLWFKHFGSHVIPENRSGKYDYISSPYLHMKSLESFCENDVWQAFLSPPGQNYSPEESVKFKMFTSCYKTTKEFKNATRKGTWPPTLKKFAWDNRLEYNRPISRLAWVYWILEGHAMPQPDESMTWKNVSQYVLSPESMSIYQSNKSLNKGIIINE